LKGGNTIGKQIISLKSHSKAKVFLLLTIIFAIASLSIVVSIERKTINLIDNGKQRKIVTFKNTVGEVLKKENIVLGLKDKIVPSLKTQLKENDTIEIKRAVNVHVLIDGKDLTIKSSEENVGLMLKEEGIAINEEDKVKPDLDAKLSEGMTIKITRYETKTVTENVPINFKEIVKIDRRLANTKRKVIQEGKPGIKKITTCIAYENGKEIWRKLIDETVVKQPQDKLIAQGAYPLMPVSRGGSIMPYRNVMRMRATAYWAVNGVGKTYTASGRKAVRDPDGYSTIAVDPKVIPFGTKLFVEGYGFAIAAESGSAIKGNKIDVFFNTYKEACDWAVKYVNVYILE
jgi:uncharacterized protein YabE (DUF348 family)